MELYRRQPGYPPRARGCRPRAILADAEMYHPDAYVSRIAPTLAEEL